MVAGTGFCLAAEMVVEKDADWAALLATLMVADLADESAEK